MKRSNVTRLAIRSLLMAAMLAVAAVGGAYADSIYDSNLLQRMHFSASQRAKVHNILEQSSREVSAIFRKYGINPDAKPDFDKLQEASRELLAVEAREKRAMKQIISREQYRTYLAILQETATRVIKATRQ